MLSSWDDTMFDCCEDVYIEDEESPRSSPIKQCELKWNNNNNNNHNVSVITGAVDQDWKVVNWKGTVVYVLILLDFIKYRSHIKAISIQANQEWLKNVNTDVFFSEFKFTCWIPCFTQKYIRIWKYNGLWIWFNLLTWSWDL